MRITSCLFAGAAAIASLGAAPSAPAQTLADHYDFTIVDFPGAPQTNIFAINNRRQYVGAWIDTAGNNHAIFFDGYKLAALDPTGPIGTSPNSFALSLNNSGCLVGGFQGGAHFHGFLDCRGHVQQIDFPDALSTEVFGINDFGEMIGIYRDQAKQLHAFRAFRDHFVTDDIPGAVQTIPFSVNDSGTIVGEDITVANTNGHGYIETLDGRRTIVDAPGAPANSTFFISANNAFEILGAFADASGVQRNFLVDDGQFLPFDVPASFGSTLTSAQTINDRQDIVGFFNDAAGNGHGFVALRKMGQ
jgi:hypothetical protein